jgi:catecholate siderophore receptor
MGVLYGHARDWTSYASYGTSFNPSTENYTIGNNAGIPPEKNRNLEVGSKWDAASGHLSLRAALFRTEKTHERNTDLTSSTTVLSGRRHTDGIELEAAGRISREWSVFASAALFRAEIDEAAPGSNMSANVGKRPGNTPPYALTLWSTYKPLARWTVGGGVEAVGNRTPQENYVNIAPHYARVDALVQYEIDAKTSIRINGNNLTNKKIYSGLYRGFAVPAPTRQVLASLTWKF